MSEVARIYRFEGVHHVPGLPEPWCKRHAHAYTVEVVARSPRRQTLVLDTDLLDEAWESIQGEPPVDLDARYGPENTTVEALSATWLDMLNFRLPAVARVVVWEDTSRWGSAETE